MKVFFLLGGLLLASSLLATPLPNPKLSSAKTEVSGRIVDADLNQPLEFATVSAFAPDSSLVAGASTDSLGKFSLVLPKGQYRLVFEFIGYLATEQEVDVRRDVDLGSIALNANAVALEGATVTAQRSQLTLKLDKQIYDVGADIVSQGGSANEVLENVPSIDVSPEGVVSLRGNSGVKVLINGKPSAMADNNALQSIPAENIAKVEIMTNPSARYEASGSGGIINIVLKQNAQRNIGGQVSATVGLPTDYRLNGSFSASLDKWTLFGNAGARYSEYYSTGEANRRSELPSGTQLLREDLIQDRSDKARNGFGGLDFRPNERTTLSASYSHYYQLDDDLSNVRYDYRDGAGNLTREWQQSLSYREPGKYNQIEASLSHDLPGKNRKLFVLFQNDFWLSPEQERTLIDETFPNVSQALDLQTESRESSNDYLLQVDYEQPLGEEGKLGKLELGLRGETRIIASDYIAEQVKDGERSVYLGFDNEVDYYERIGAAYVQYGLEKGKWGVQLGLRNEYTDVRVEQENGEADIEKRYNNLFPSATVSRKLGEKTSINVGYSRRIRRPGFWMINPFGGIANPNELQLGNADINPSYAEAGEVKFLYQNDKLTINPFVSLSFIDGFYDRYATQDSSGLVRLLQINLDQERQVASGITLSYSPTEDIQLTGEGYLARFTQRGEYEGIDFGNAFTMKSLQLSVRAKLFADIRGQATYDYWGGQRYAQFYQDPVQSIRAGLSRQFLDDRLQVSLNVRNLFGLQVFEGGSSRASFTNTYSRVWQQERWQVTAAWDIGKDVRVRRARGSIR